MPPTFAGFGRGHVGSLTPNLLELLIPKLEPATYCFWW